VLTHEIRRSGVAAKVDESHSLRHPPPLALIERELLPDGVADAMRSRRSLGEGGRIVEVAIDLPEPSWMCRQITSLGRTRLMPAMTSRLPRCSTSPDNH
jgi:hypothetical protein